MRRLISWMALLFSLCLCINAALSEKIRLDSNLLESAFRSLLGNMEMRRVTEADQERIVADLKALDIIVPTEIVEEYNAVCGEEDEGEDGDSWSIMETPQGFAITMYSGAICTTRSSVSVFFIRLTSFMPTRVDFFEKSVFSVLKFPSG